MGQFIQENVFLITLVVAIAAWLLLRTRGTQVATDASLGGRVGSGRPTVMEFFSNT